MDLTMKHILLEVFYDEKLDIKKIFEDSTTIEEIIEMGISFTFADNELAYAGEYGVIEEGSDFVAFGGGMDVDYDLEGNEEIRSDLLHEWKKISKRKIKEASEEYYQFKKVYFEKLGIKDEMLGED